MRMPHQVLVCIFSADDPRSVPQRLEQAAASFCRNRGLPAVPAEDLVTDRTDRGKPYFPRSAHLHLSISHSGSYWACAIADQPVGLDLQQAEQPRQETREEMLRRHRKMANRFFHPLEADFVARDCAHNFLTVWTAREAYVKLTGQGIDRYFSEHCVVPEEPGDLDRISGGPDGVLWSAMEKHFRRSAFAGEYVLCLCTDAPTEYTITEFPMPAVPSRTADPDLQERRYYDERTY